MNHQPIATLIDTHAHLHFEQFAPDLPRVIQRAKTVGLTKVINIGSDLENSQKAINLKSDQINLYSTIGIHPHEAANYDSIVSIHKSIGELEQLYLSNTPKVVGIGECGLDYFYRDKSGSPATLPPNIVNSQKELFQAQIDLAKKLKLPIIIHCREAANHLEGARQMADLHLPGGNGAWRDIFEFDYQGLSGVFHSFTDTLESAKIALDLGFYLGFSCIVTYPKNDRLMEVIKYAPIDRILTETDCPFLPPQTKRGQRNEPANVSEVIQVISEVRSISYEQAAQKTFENAIRLF